MRCIDNRHAHPECECALNQGSYKPAAFKEASHTPAAQGRRQNADKRRKSHPALLCSFRSQQLSESPGAKLDRRSGAAVHQSGMMAETREASLRPV
jgi:hypothetical protein